jgi:hypothetical protein
LRWVKNVTFKCNGIFLQSNVSVRCVALAG